MQDIVIYYLRFYVHTLKSIITMSIYSLSFPFMWQGYESSIMHMKKNNKPFIKIDRVLYERPVWKLIRASNREINRTRNVIIFIMWKLRLRTVSKIWFWHWALFIMKPRITVAENIGRRSNEYRINFLDRNNYPV